jgi:very-short-patch-repair endonuclease
MISDTARRLRRDMTDAERAMWRLLRSRKLAGFKFRRQQPIRRYIVDFVCFSHSLVVEIDGGQHADSKNDEVRSRFLAREGSRVLRFWNNEVLDNRDGVCARILEVLGGRTPPLPSLRDGPCATGNIGDRSDRRHG